MLIIFDHQLSIQSVDKEAIVYNLNTKWRSREWKGNVLHNAQIIRHSVSFDKKGKHQLMLKSESNRYNA